MLEQLQNQITAAAQHGEKMRVVGNGSKHGHIPAGKGKVLNVAQYAGIIDYLPNELVIRVRGGTPLAEIEAALAERKQMLAAEPPNFDMHSTIGGALACGWSGPRRPWAGALRDHVLGITMINGRGELLRFGGSVIKNVAGFDVSRLMVGSLGSLGVIVEASIKVVPRPEEEIVLGLPCGQADAIRLANQACASAIPVTGAAWENDVLRIRLSGNTAAVAAGRTRLGGHVDEDGSAWFDRLRHFRHALFATPRAGMTLWRLSLPPATPPLLVGYPQLIDWGGGQRWLLAHEDASSIIQAATQAAGGYASCRSTSGLWPQPAGLAPAIEALNQRIKLAFDPAGIFADAPPFA
jgi:glycolate oxidase FAD binding subunit